MEEFSNQDLIIERQVMSREEAIRQFSDMGEKYKVEIIQDLPAGGGYLRL